MKRRRPTDKVESKQIPPTRPLLRLSLILWLLSLPLPAFYIDEENSLWLGIFVLLVGLPLGWLGAGLAGLAVYANVFYYYAFRKLSANKTPRISIILMLLFASLSVFLQVVMVSELPSYAPVFAWGWGAVVWAMSLVALACAAWLPERFKSRRYMLPATLTLLALFAAVASGLFILKYTQYQRANDDERRRYLPTFAAFSVARFSGLAYIRPPENLNITPDTIFELQGDLIEGQENMYLLIKAASGKDKPLAIYDLPRKFQYGNYSWRFIIHRDFFDLYELTLKRQPDYIYRARLVNPNQFEHVLTDARTNRILWQAPVNFRDTYDKYPDYDLDALFNPKIEPEIRKEKHVWQEEVFNQSCPSQPYTADPEIHDAVQWQGRILKIVRSHGRHNQHNETPGDLLPVYCSKHYALFLYYYSGLNVEEEYRVFRGWILDRNTSEALADIDFTYKSKSNTDYPALTDSGELPPGINFQNTRLTRYLPKPCNNDASKNCGDAALVIPTDRGDINVFINPI